MLVGVSLAVQDGWLLVHPERVAGGGGGGCLSPDSERVLIIKSFLCSSNGQLACKRCSASPLFRFFPPKLRSEMLFDEDDKVGRVGDVGHLVSCVTRQLHWGVCHQQQQPAAKGDAAQCCAASMMSATPRTEESAHPVCFVAQEAAGALVPASDHIPMQTTAIEMSARSRWHRTWPGAQGTRLKRPKKRSAE